MTKFPRWEDALAAATIAIGQTDAEYATAIFDICGVASTPSVRRNLERLVHVIKVRTVQNVRDHQRAERAAGRVEEFLRQAREKAQ